jgi:hypothetical protein
VIDEAQGRDPFPYPRGSVVGGFIDQATFDAARDRLEQAGFGSDSCQLLHGEADADRIDVTGETHGWTGSVIRKLQDAVTDEGELTRRYADHLRAGHYLIGVRVGGDEAAKQRAAEALGGANAQFLTYYANHFIEDLGGTG